MHFVDYIQIALQVIGVASTAAAIIPQASPAVPFLGLARQILDVLAANFANAKNAPKA